MSKIIKDSYEEFIRRIEKHPELSEETFEATTVLGARIDLKHSTRQFEFHYDEPEVLGENNNVPNPVEYILGSIGVCQTVAYRALASLKGIKIEGITVKTKGSLDFNDLLAFDGEFHPGFKNVMVETILLSDENPAVLYSLSKQVERLCPVLDIVSNPLAVKGRLTIKSRKAEELAMVG